MVLRIAIEHSSLDIRSSNDKMPYSGQLNTLEKEMPQLLLLNSFPTSSLLLKSSLLLLAFIFFFFTIAVIYEKQHTICSLSSKTFPSFVSAAIYFICLSFQCILLSQHTLQISLSMEKTQTVSKNSL